MSETESGWAPRTDRMFDKERDEEILHHINEAHKHAQDAQELLYGVRKQYRGVWYRFALGRAQSLLIGLLNKEYNRKRS